MRWCSEKPLQHFENEHARYGSERLSTVQKHSTAAVLEVLNRRSTIGRGACGRDLYCRPRRDAPRLGHYLFLRREAIAVLLDAGRVPS